MSRLSNDARWLVKEIAQAKRMASNLGKPQLANSSIESGQIEEYDSDGVLVQIVGEQYDGTHAPVTVNGPIPPEPTPPTITPGFGLVEARWSGKFAGGEVSPMDFSHVALHGSRLEAFTPDNSTHLATITGELGDVATVSIDSGEWTFGLVAVSKAGKWSEMSEPVTLDVPDVSGGTEEIVDALLGLGSAVDGKITVDIKAPTLADGDGKPMDALWNELDPVTREQVAVWRWNGTAWENMPLSELIVPKINIAQGTYGLLEGVQLKADALNGKVITGSLVQSDEESDKGIKLDTAGMRVYGSEGGEPVTEVRADGGTVYSIIDPATGDTLAALDSDGGIVGKTLDIEGEVTAGGVRLIGNSSFEAFSTDYGAGILDFFPRGMVVRGYRDSRGFSATNREGEILEMSYDNEINRGYRIHVAPFMADVAPDTTGVLRIYHTRDGSRPTMASPILHSQFFRNRDTTTVGAHFGGTFYDLGGSGKVRYLFTFRGEGGQMLFTGASPGGQFRAWVEDIGYAPPETGINRTGARDLEATAPPAPPEPEPENYVQTWTANGYRSFEGNSRYTYADGKNRMYQGDGPYAGMLRSIATFGNGSKGQSISSALSGATITSIRVTITFPHWYYGSGGTAELMLHGESSLPETLPSMTQATWKTKVPRGGTVTFAIPSTYWNGFKSGTYRGIGLGAGNSGFTYYGYAKGSSVKLEIKYTK